MGYVSAISSKLDCARLSLNLQKIITIVHKYILILSLFLTVAVTATAEKTSNSDRIEATTDGIEIWADTNTLFVNNGEPGSIIVIYSIVGTKVKEVELKSPSSETPLQLPKGYYIVKIGEVARKIAVK